jgi:hypothetical protein
MAQFGDFTVDRNSTKYVLGSGGTIISYATDEPAFEFNADGSYKGLLVEPAATNIIKYSEDFRNTADAGETRPWSYAATGTGITPIVTHNYATSPDGTTNATRIQLDLDGGTTSNDISQVGQSQTITSSTVYTASIWMKSADGNSYDVAIDINSGGVPSLVATVTNQWQRFEVTDTSVSTAGFLRIRLRGDESTSDSADILVWGAQLETGPIATSYIPTTTASVTRNKDDITLGSASSLIGQTEGTLYVEVDWRLTTGTTQALLEASDGSLDNRVQIYNQGGSVQLRMLANVNGGTEEVNQGVDSSGFSGIQKIAFAYKTDDFELYRNGSSIATDTTGSLASLATLTDIDLGQNSNTDVQANMWIRAVALYPKRLSDAECEALTTL